MNEEKILLGIAPIVWTNDDMPELGKNISFDQALDEMMQAGFVGCEVGAAYPEDVHALLEALRRRRLRIASRWFGSQLLTQPLEVVAEEFQNALRYLKGVGATHVNVCEVSYSTFDDWNKPLYGASYQMNNAEWKRLTVGMNYLGKLAVDNGVKLCYHHHLGAVVETADEVEQFMQSTDAERVWLCYDTGHFLAVGSDPMSMLKQYFYRVGHVHLKDYRKNIYDAVIAEKKCFRQGVLDGVFTVPGDGDFDFTPVFDLLKHNGYTGWMVVEAEQDPDKANPLEYACKARQYIKEKCGL